MASSTTTSDPTIRFATEDDVPTILALIHELAAYERASSSVLATEATLRSTLSFPSSPQTGYARTLLIYPPPSPSTPPKAAGMALYYPSYSTWRAAPGIYLEDLFVRPAFRGRGYGTRLLKRLAQETREIGGERLEWSVLRWNEPSLKFYEGRGVGAKRMEEWVGMRVDGEALVALAGGDGDGDRGERRRCFEEALTLVGL